MPKFLIIDGSSMLSTSYYWNLPKSILFAKTEEEKEIRKENPDYRLVGRVKAILPKQKAK